MQNTVIKYSSFKQYKGFFNILGQMWRQVDGEVLSDFILEVKHCTKMLCCCSSDYKELRSPRLNSRSRFHVWGNPCHSLYHLTDRCQRNQRQPIMLIPPVIMCDDPAVTRSCGKYVRQYHRRRQMHQILLPMPTTCPPDPSSLHPPPPCSFLPPRAAAFSLDLSIKPLPSWLLCV